MRVDQETLPKVWRFISKVPFESEIERLRPLGAASAAGSEAKLVSLHGAGGAGRGGGAGGVGRSEGSPCECGCVASDGDVDALVWMRICSLPCVGVTDEVALMWM